VYRWGRNRSHLDCSRDGARPVSILFPAGYQNPAGQLKLIHSNRNSYTNVIQTLTITLDKMNKPLVMTDEKKNFYHQILDNRLPK